MSAIAACFAKNGPSVVFSFQAIKAMDHPPNATAQPDERMAEVGRRERALECPDMGLLESDLCSGWARSVQGIDLRGVLLERPEFRLRAQSVSDRISVRQW